MIKLERSKMTNAINKAKQLRPRVRMIGERTYSVSGSRGNTYTVFFSVAKDAQGNAVRLGECTCPAGHEGMVCYHLVAAAAVNIAVQTMRQQVKTEAAKAAPVTSAAVPVASEPAADERESLIQTVKKAWHRARPFASLDYAVRQIFGATPTGIAPG